MLATPRQNQRSGVENVRIMRAPLPSPARAADAHQWPVKRGIMKAAGTPGGVYTSRGLSSLRHARLLREHLRHPVILQIRPALLTAHFRQRRRRDLAALQTDHHALLARQ